MKYKVIIVDDEENARLLMQSRLLKNFPEIRIVAMCESAAEASLEMHKHKPDIVFLDIQMPGVTGIEFLGYIKDIVPRAKVIIVSAYPEQIYFQKAIRCDVVDYLVKPYTAKELVESVNTCMLKINEKNITDLYDYISNQGKIRLKAPRQYIYINSSEVIYAKSDGKLSVVRLNKSRTEIVIHGLTELHTKLESDKCIVRVDRFTLVNTKYIRRLIHHKHFIVFDDENTEFSIEVTKTGINALLSI